MGDRKCVASSALLGVSRVALLLWVFGFGRVGFHAFQHARCRTEVYGRNHHWFARGVLFGVLVHHGNVEPSGPPPDGS